MVINAFENQLENELDEGQYIDVNKVNSLTIFNCLQEVKKNIEGMFNFNWR